MMVPGAAVSDTVSCKHGDSGDENDHCDNRTTDHDAPQQSAQCFANAAMEPFGTPTVTCEVLREAS